MLEAPGLALGVSKLPMAPRVSLVLWYAHIIYVESEGKFCCFLETYMALSHEIASAVGVRFYDVTIILCGARG